MCLFNLDEYMYGLLSGSTALKKVSHVAFNSVVYYTIHITKYEGSIVYMVFIQFEPQNVVT